MTYKPTAYRIERMPDGGFAVAEAPGFDTGRYCPMLFACTDIADALAYIGDRLDPPNQPTD